MNKICISCGKNKPHHGRGLCQQCYKMFIRNGKKLPLPKRQESNEPQQELDNATIDEDSQQQIAERPVEIKQFSRHVNLLVNRLNVKCLRCSHTIESEIACKHSLIYCGFCYFNKTGAKRPKSEIVEHPAIIEQSAIVENVEVALRPAPIPTQTRIPLNLNIVSDENFIVLSSGEEGED